MDFHHWLESIGLGSHIPLFHDNEIDFDVLSEVTDDQLNQIGVPLGARIRLRKALANSSDDVNQSEASPPIAQAERRQITVLFFDLVGSTAISTKLDPEDLREVIGGFQSAIAATISDYNGFVAKYMGDGLLCYFGWPNAQEDAASQAVRAALQAQLKVSELPLVLSEPLRARAGIATGQVVVGDLIGKGASAEEAIIGQTPNLAARLQGIAKPGQVVISSNTLSLIGESFETIILEPVALKGFDILYKPAVVISERVGGPRFALKKQQNLPAVGRKLELALLRDRWQQSRCGEGQFVLLTGEAGIGKSRLISSLLESEKLQETIILQCSPYNSDTPLWPVVDFLQEHLCLKENESIDESQGRLHQLFVHTPGLSDEQAVAAVSDLLNITFPSKTRKELAPSEKRQRILSTLLNWLTSVKGSPRLLVIEDAHWIDPTTLELLLLILDDLHDSALMVLTTSRPENCPVITDSSLLTHLSLNRLSLSSVRRLIGMLFENDVPEEYVKQLIQRSDGVPLYVEELTRTLLSGATQNIPATLHDGLMARLDALPRTRRIAQQAACIGREFDLELLKSISLEQGEILNSGLQELVESGLLQESSGVLGSQYRFKHALVRDAAYESLLKQERLKIHSKIAKFLAGQSEYAWRGKPELIAMHYYLANLFSEAFGYWIQACKKALESSAINEALAHGARALSIVDKVPASEQRDKLEYTLQMYCGSALQVVKGFAAPETGNAFKRAAELAAQLGQDREQLFAQLNTWSFHHHSGNFEKASQLIKLNFKMSLSINDRELTMQANHAAWTTGFHFDSLDKLNHHIERGLELYDEEEHRLCWTRFCGHDPAVCGYGHGAWVKWFQGFPEDAVDYVNACRKAAMRSGHKGSELIALGQKCFLGYYARNYEMLFESAELVQSIAKKLRAGVHLTTLADLLSGWASVQNGAVQAGLERVETAMESLSETNTKHRQSFNALVYADTLASAGQQSMAIQVAIDGLQKADNTGETRWKGELIRLVTKLRWTNLELSNSQAIELFQNAINYAEEHGGRIYRLRAVRNLAEVYVKEKRNDEAYELLSKDYDWFTQGRNELDLREAEEQLSLLSS